MQHCNINTNKAPEGKCEISTLKMTKKTSMSEIDKGLIYRLEKPHSPIIIGIYEEEDPFLLRVSKEKRTGQVVDYAYIIRPDLENKLEFLKLEGFKITDNMA